MYKILLADDEAIMLDAMQFIIRQNFADSCQIEIAKTGRSAIEAAESLRPDIAVMDIQMPGLNGLDAMREMRRANMETIFIVVSAYNRFDYAQESLPLGVMEYLNKPLDRARFTEVLHRAMQRVDEEHRRRTSDLELREKLETANPMIENGLLLAILFQRDYAENVSGFRQLLGITAPQGFLMVLECTPKSAENGLPDTIHAAAEADIHFAAAFREAVKAAFACMAGPMMAGMMPVYVPWEAVEGKQEYDMRVTVIERARVLAHTLRERLGIAVRIGMGSLLPMDEAADSYREALEALHYASGTVAHAKDLPIRCGYAGNYPEKTEKRLFAAIERGSTAEALEEAASFFDWMLSNHADDPMDIRLKVLEFVLDAEYICYTAGGMTYDFCSRADYLPSVMEMPYDELRYWFFGKLRAACHHIRTGKEESSRSVTQQAQSYIHRHFADDISLDDISYAVNVSPYYFSKLFKAETGMNFIDYLTQLRMDKAKDLLAHTNKSMKEICREVGYSDPNYFSRSFKKNVGLTPTEYKGNV